MQSLFSPHGHPKMTGISGLGSGVLKLPVDFNTADGAVLATVPAGHYLRVNRTWWDVQTGFTGGTSSAIGASSSNSAYSTKGDLQGGASGDLAAALVAGQKGGTIGAKFGSNGVVVLGPGDTIRFDRIASQFTAGAGFLMVEVSELGETLA